MAAYYNEWDKPTAAWLRELIKAGLIMDGDVDERSIKDVQASDLTGFTRCHFFAGIGGWDYALQLAGYPDDVPVWTGSCPCQPFSNAGSRKGVDDERHLWPDMLRLIAACKPQRILGEQVASAVGHGWLDGVFTDLEKEGYACGAVVLGAHSVGAPHIRQRCYWVADAECERNWQQQGLPTPPERLVRADSNRAGRSRGYSSPCVANGIRLADPQDADRRRPRGADDTGWRDAETGGSGGDRFWSDCGSVACRDSKVRRIEPGSFPLAHGVPARVVRLRGYGNAIVPQVAAEFIKAYLEVVS